MPAAAAACWMRSLEASLASSSSKRAFSCLSAVARSLTDAIERLSRSTSTLKKTMPTSSVPIRSTHARPRRRRSSRPCVTGPSRGNSSARGSGRARAAAAAPCARPGPELRRAGRAGRTGARRGAGGLEHALGRMAAAELLGGRHGRLDRVHELEGGLYRSRLTPPRDCTRDLPGKALLSVAPEQLGQAPLVPLVHHFARVELL